MASNDGVSIALELILDEISVVAEQLRKENADALGAEQFPKAKTLIESAEKLVAFREKLRALQTEWRSGIDQPTRTRVQPAGYEIPPHDKGPATHLRVALPDGTVIQEPTAALTFAKALEAVGLDKVRTLGLKLNGFPLVDTSAHPKYQQQRLGRYWVATHSNTAKKQEILRQVARMLGLQIKVFIV